MVLALNDPRRLIYPETKKPNQTCTFPFFYHLLYLAHVFKYNVKFFEQSVCMVPAVSYRPVRQKRVWFLAVFILWVYLFSAGWLLWRPFGGDTVIFNSETSRYLKEKLQKSSFLFYLILNTWFFIPFDAVIKPFYAISVQQSPRESYTSHFPGRTLVFANTIWLLAQSAEAVKYIDWISAEG